MRIPRRKIKQVVFEGYDGRVYEGHTEGVRNGIGIVCYYVPGLGWTRAYLDRSAWNRVHPRRAKPAGAGQAA